MTLFDLNGKKAFITGASRGIGQEIAMAFAEAGADLALVARSEDCWASSSAMAAMVRVSRRNSPRISRTSSSRPAVDSSTRRDRA